MIVLFDRISIWNTVHSGLELYFNSPLREKGYQRSFVSDMYIMLYNHHVQRVRMDDQHMSG